jgi:hypothetical protein
MTIGLAFFAGADLCARDLGLVPSWLLHPAASLHCDTTLVGDGDCTYVFGYDRIVFAVVGLLWLLVHLYLSLLLRSSHFFSPWTSVVAAHDEQLAKYTARIERLTQLPPGMGPRGRRWGSQERPLPPPPPSDDAVCSPNGGTTATLLAAPAPTATTERAVLPPVKMPWRTRKRIVPTDGGVAGSEEARTSQPPASSPADSSGDGGPAAANATADVASGTVANGVADGTAPSEAATSEAAAGKRGRRLRAPGEADVAYHPGRNGANGETSQRR